MTSTIKAIQDWDTIMLDTSVIIDFWKVASSQPKNPVKKLQIENIQMLMEHLNVNKPGAKLMVSSVTIAELIQADKTRTWVDKIATAFYGSNVQVVDFSQEIAEIIHQEILDHHLPVSQYNQIINDLKKNGISWGRPWVNGDLKILATALFFKKKIDVVLTSDGRVFSEIGRSLNLPILNTNMLGKDMFGKLDCVNDFTL